MKQCTAPPGSKGKGESKGVHMGDIPSNQNWELTVPLYCTGDAEAARSPSRARPFPHFKVLPWRDGNRELLGRPSVGNSLVEQRLERPEILILNRVVLQGIEIVCHDLCFPANVSHSLLSSSPHITMALETFGYLFLPLPSLTHQIFVGLILGTVSDIQNESVILLIFFFLPAKCEPVCRHGGVCVRPNKCLCKKGYLGPQCEQVDRNIRRVTRAGILDQIIDMTSYLLDLTSYIV